VGPSRGRFRRGIYIFQYQIQSVSGLGIGSDGEGAWRTVLDDPAIPYIRLHGAAEIRTKFSPLIEQAFRDNWCILQTDHMVVRLHHLKKFIVKTLVAGDQTSRWWEEYCPTAESHIGLAV
jgi:hypothetical protein